MITKFEHSTPYRFSFPWRSLIGALAVTRAKVATSLRSMRKETFPLAALMAMMIFGNPIIADAQTFSGTFSFSSATGDVISLPYNGTAIPNLTVGPLVKTGLTSSPSSGNSRASAWPTGATSGSDTFAGTIDTSKYFEFTITANSGFLINNPSITFGIGRSSTGPRQWEWRSSVDNYAAPLSVTTVSNGLTHLAGILTNPDANSSWTGNVISTSGAAFEGLTSITFRLYGYNAESSTGTGGLQGNLSFSGDLIAPSTDQSPPAVITLSPALNAREVALNTPISITFNEPVRAATGNVILFQGGAEVQRFAASAGTITENTVTFTPSSSLQLSLPYHVIVEETAFTDTAGNPFPGLLSPSAWSFRTITAASLTASTPYLEDFAAFVDANSIPAGWSIAAPVTTYGGNWGTGSSIGLRGASSVLGYQHTGNSGVVVKKLLLVNSTDAPITDLTISYRGRVSRTSETRIPIYTVAVNGTAVPALSFSTAESDNTLKSAVVTDLNIAPGATVEITWSSERGESSGSSRQIGISSVNISSGATLLPPTVATTTFAASSLSPNGFSIVSEVIADGGSALIARGFVIAETNFNSAPEIDGPSVTTLTDSLTTLGALSRELTNLSPETSYTIRSFAVNQVGTIYSTPIVITTLPLPPLFTGLYTQDFASYSGTFPAGWFGYSSNNVNSYGGLWGGGTIGGFRGGVIPGVLGYQHTSSTGLLTINLNLVNDTGSPIEELFVSYLGLVERADQGSSPEWTVSINGNPVPAIAYSTQLAASATRSAMITDLNIAPGAAFTITWQSDRGTVSNTPSRQIGISDVVVSLQAPAPVNTLASWISNYDVGLATGPFDTPSADGVPNIIKHVLGLAPNLPVTGSLMTPTASTSNSLTFSHSRIKLANLASDVSPSYEWSTDLSQWHADGVTANGIRVTFSEANIVNSRNSDFDIVSSTATVTEGSAPKLFVRIKATLGPSPQ